MSFLVYLNNGFGRLIVVLLVLDYGKPIKIIIFLLKEIKINRFFDFLG